MATKLKKQIIAVFSLFTLMLCGWLAFGTLNVIKALRTYSWPHIDGVVLSTNIEKIHGGKGPTKYSPKINYSFKIGSTEYESSQYSVTIARGTLLWATEVVKQNPVNSTVQVYYNPENPGNSILVKGLQSDDYWMFLLPLSCLLVILLAFKKQLNRKFAEPEMITNQPFD